MGFEDRKRQSSIEKQCAFKGAIEYLKDRPDAKKEDVVNMTNYFYEELFKDETPASSYSNYSNGNQSSNQNGNNYSKGNSSKPASDKQINLIKALVNKSSSVSDSRKLEIRDLLKEVGDGKATLTSSDVQTYVKELGV